MPESLVDGMGRARFFHTVLDGSPVLVRTREGRPILVTPARQRPERPRPQPCAITPRSWISTIRTARAGRCRCAAGATRGGVELDGGRRRRRREAEGGRREGGPADRPVRSPALAAAIAALTAQTGLRHVVWSPLAADAAGVGLEAGVRRRAASRRPRLDKADLVVGLGAEFLDRPDDGLERDFAARRSPDQPAAAG